MTCALRIFRRSLALAALISIIGAGVSKAYHPAPSSVSVRLPVAKAAIRADGCRVVLAAGATVRCPEGHKARFEWRRRTGFPVAAVIVARPRFRGSEHLYETGGVIRDIIVVTSGGTFYGVDWGGTSRS